MFGEELNFIVIPILRILTILLQFIAFIQNQINFFSIYAIQIYR